MKKPIENHSPSSSEQIYLYLVRFPRGFLYLSVILLISSFVSALIFPYAEAKGDWYRAYEYISNIIIVPIITSYYFSVFGFYIAGYKTASLKILLSGLLINYATVIFAFAWLYAFISSVDVSNFSAKVDWLTGLSNSVGIATTIGPIVTPLSASAQISVICQQIISYLVTVIAMSWIFSQISNRKPYVSEDSK